MSISFGLVYRYGIAGFHIEFQRCIGESSQPYFAPCLQELWPFVHENSQFEITCHGSYTVGTQNNRLIETLLLSTKAYVKTDGLENVYNFTLKVYLYL